MEPLCLYRRPNFRDIAPNKRSLAQRRRVVQENSCSTFLALLTKIIDFDAKFICRYKNKIFILRCTSVLVH